MNEIRIIPLATPDKYLVMRKDCRQIPSERMQRIITQGIGFKYGAIVSNLTTGGDGWVYLVERAYE